MDDAQPDGNENSQGVGKIVSDVQAIGDAARQTGEQAKKAGVEALDHARDVANNAKEHAASIAGTLGEKVSGVAEAQMANIAEQLENVAKAVHHSGEQLEGQQDWVAQLVERGAEELSALATTLRTNDLQSLLNNLGDLARRQPALFVGVSMAAGFALTRVGRIAASSKNQVATPHQSDAAPSSAPAASVTGTSSSLETTDGHR